MKTSMNIISFIKYDDEVLKADGYLDELCTEGRNYDE